MVKSFPYVRCHVVDILCDFLSPLLSGHEASAPPPPSPPLPHGKYKIITICLDSSINYNTF